MPLTPAPSVDSALQSGRFAKLRGQALLQQGLAKGWVDAHDSSFRLPAFSLAVRRKPGTTETSSARRSRPCGQAWPCDGYRRRDHRLGARTPNGSYAGRAEDELYRSLRACGKACQASRSAGKGARLRETPSRSRTKRLAGSGAWLDQGDSRRKAPFRELISPHAIPVARPAAASADRLWLPTEEALLHSEDYERGHPVQFRSSRSACNRA